MRYISCFYDGLNKEGWTAIPQFLQHHTLVLSNSTLINPGIVLYNFQASRPRLKRGFECLNWEIGGMQVPKSQSYKPSFGCHLTLTVPPLTYIPQAPQALLLCRLRHILVLPGLNNSVPFLKSIRIF